jgi:hypothetical protein
MNIVALLLGLGIPLVGLVALTLGIVALVRINRSNGALRGRGLAIAAIVLGALMLLAPCLFAPLLWWARASDSAPPPPASRIAPPEPGGAP